MNLTDHLAQLEVGPARAPAIRPRAGISVQEHPGAGDGLPLRAHERRRELHGQAARTIETHMRTGWRKLAPLLAHHYAEAGADPSATLKYARMAGDTASRRYANTEAIQHYGIALTAAQAAPAVESGTLLHLYTSRGRACELSGDYDQALANYADMSACG